MLILGLDTATPTGSIAVLRDGRLIGVISTSTEETYSSRLFRQLEFLLGELSLNVSQFDVFAVAAGPGSFTGLRVGIAAVKGWAEVFSKPIVAVSGLEAVAAQARACNGLVASVLDAPRGQIYAALFRGDSSSLSREGDDEVCTAAEFLAGLPARVNGRSVQFISPTPEIIDPALAALASLPESASRSVLRASPVLAPEIAAIAFERAKRGEFTDALHLDANYVRPSDAELLWKDP
ncbi:MAG TPA: tRNA (adenosine(37)-N6)-threonylcarbamoyltransferase complex dimerization subunit type 1 TsaB [Candidatus Acidoferrales bacterium]|nr:tRNA (adenosine(37)-N6)-threonylcarbamoyltransferase complex dimerization subunit type 1 TsaB [Candidatus Acidoferrales bacterium]